MNDDVCNPFIEINSSIGGCDLFSNSIIWEYLDYAKPYIGFIGIGAGILLAFFGLKLIKPSICIGGFVTCTMLSLLIFYAVYIKSVEDKGRIKASKYQDSVATKKPKKSENYK